MNNKEKLCVVGVEINRKEDMEMKKHKYNITSEVSIITPNEAKTILDGHNNYRKLSRGRVNAYSNLMREGNWELSIIIFDDNGDLIDGQTRLQSVVETGLPQPFVCLFGWPKKITSVLDNGQNRTRTQVAKAERNLKGNVSKTMALVCGIVNGPNNVGVTTNLKALEYYDRYCDIADLCIPFMKDDTVLRSSVSVLPFARAMAKHPESAGDIYKGLCKLSELDFCDPRDNSLKIYYQYLSVIHGKIGRDINRVDVYLRGARAVQAYLDGISLSRLYRVKEDPFKIDE